MNTAAKYRNTFGTTWRKELWITNVKPATSGVALMSTNFDGSLLSLPWHSQGGDGRLAVFPSGTIGKLPSPPATIQAHKSAILDLCWSPFCNSVCTVSREPVAKVWSVPTGGLTDKNNATLVTTLPHPGCRAVSVHYHPHVDNLIMSTGSDNALHIWDLNNADSAAKLVLSSAKHPDAIQSAEWDAEHGSLIVTASKDMNCRIYDVRASPEPVACQRCCTDSNNPKNFSARFLEHRSMVLTIGVNKKSDRIIEMRDARMLDKIMSTVIVDQNNPYPLYPHYDTSTGMLYLGSRGTVTFAYEIHSIAPYAILVGRITSKSNHSAICMAPKRVCDVLKCETARLYSLTVDNIIEPITVAVQRKSEMLSIFHEDLFPPAASFQPCPVTAEQWLDKEAHVMTEEQVASLQPEGTKSIFDIPLSEGGKNREQEEHRNATITTLSDEADTLAAGSIPPVTEGKLLFRRPTRRNKGETEFTLRYVTLVHGRIYVFENEESPSSIVWIDADDITEVVDRVEGDKPELFIVKTCEEDGVEYPFIADSEIMKKAWVRSVKSLAAATQKSTQNREECNSPSPQLVDPKVPSPAGSPAVDESSTPIKVPSPVPGLIVSHSPASSGSGSFTPTHMRQQGRKRSYSSSRSPLPENVLASLTSVMYAHIPGTETEKVCKQLKFSIVNHILYSESIEPEKPEEKNGVTTITLKVPTFGQQQPQEEKKATEVCHLERILSIVDTEGVFDKSLGGVSFKIVTAFGVIHLLASCPEIRTKWTRSLLRGKLEARNIGLFDAKDKASMLDSDEDSDFAGEDVEPEDIILDGPISIISERKDDEENSTEVEEKSLYWTSVLEDLFVFEDAKSCIPLEHYALGQIDSLQEVDNSNPMYEATDFEITLKCPATAGSEPSMKTLHCRCKSDNDRTMWLQGLEEKRKRSVDLLSQLGIDESNFRKDPAFKAKHVTMSDVTCGLHRMLLQVGGKRKLRVWNTELSWKSLNPNNSFILDVGDTLYVWNGIKSSRVTRGKAFDLANRVRTKDRSAHPQLVTLLQNSAAERECEAFWKALGRSLEDVAANPPKDSKTPPPPPEGVVYPTPVEQDAIGHPITIYRVGPHLVKPRYHRVRLVQDTTDRAMPSSQQCLHRNNVFVVDCGTEIYVWLGKLATDDQRDLGIVVANKMLQIRERDDGFVRPDWAVVIRVPQGAEPAVLREKFTDFPGTMPIHTYSVESTNSVAKSKLQQSVEGIVQSMQEPASLEEIPESLLPDADGQGVIAKMWRIEKYKAFEYPAEMAGHFFSGDAFVILYTYHIYDKPMHVLYFWQGRDCKNKEKGVSAMLTRDVAGTLRDEHYVQIRLVQGKETLHFTRIFARIGGGIFIHKGHFASYDYSAPHLFEIRHRPPYPCKAVETSLTAAALNSNHVFILLNPAESRVIAWIGRSCDEEERDFVNKQLSSPSIANKPGVRFTASKKEVTIEETSTTEQVVVEEEKKEPTEEKKEEQPSEKKEEEKPAEENKKEEKPAEEEKKEEEPTEEKKEEEKPAEEKPAEEEKKEEEKPAEEKPAEEEKKEEEKPAEEKPAEEEKKEEEKPAEEKPAEEEKKEEEKPAEEKPAEEEKKEEEKPAEEKPAEEEKKEEEKPAEEKPSEEEKKEEEKPSEEKTEEDQPAEEKPSEEEKVEICSLEASIFEEEKKDEESEVIDKFFSILNGKQAYYKTYPAEADSPIRHNPRLFCITHTSGSVEVDEEPNPCQDDLVAGSAYIVDAYRTVYVWMSSKTAFRTVRRLALTIALEYVHRSKLNHAADTPVLVIEAFHEPQDFTAQFHAWSKNRYAVPRGENLDEIVPPREAAEILEEEFNTKYSLADLTGKQLPKGVDPLALEQYLTDEEFEKAFKMSQDEFARLKKWQQDDLKRACGLY